MGSMESLKQSGDRVKESMGEKVKAAQDVRQQIDELKRGLEGMPAGLDQEIVTAIESARDQGKQEALSDISTAEREANSARQEGNNVNREIDTKIGDNNAAISKLEAIKSTRYGRGADTAIGAARENTRRGEDIKSELQSAMEKAMGDIESARSGI